MRKGNYQLLLNDNGFRHTQILIKADRSGSKLNAILLIPKNLIHFSFEIIFGALLLLILITAGLWFSRKMRIKALTVDRLQSVLREKESILVRRNLEREWLIGEINHRVKNNLQIISSLFSTQSAYLTNQNAQETIKSTERRLYAISLAYHSMYQSDNLSRVDLRQYVGNLLGYLKDEFDLNERIQFESGILDIKLLIEIAVPLGLIIYEAVSNAIKFAFPDNEGGKIKIGIHKPDKENLVLAISDNGVGLPPAFDPDDGNTLGSNLIIGLGRQLGGEFKLTDQKGLSLTLMFANADAGELN
jgi:two-component sensor histidine kinase